jgi:hypothetical protein
MASFFDIIESISFGGLPFLNIIESISFGGLPFLNFLLN